MRITPLDVRKQEFRKVVRGLDSDEVYAFLATIADEYEIVLTDNKQLRDKVIDLEEKVAEYRNMERTLRDTLLTAERVMTEARQNAKKEADLIIRDAKMNAEHETASISQKVESLKAQLRELKGQRDGFLARMKGLSETQLGLVESYQKDFRTDDSRIDLTPRPTTVVLDPPSSAPVSPVASGPVDPTNEPEPDDASVEAAVAHIQEDPTQEVDPIADVAPGSGPSAPVQPAQGAAGDDKWRNYDVNAAPSAGDRRMESEGPELSELMQAVYEADDGGKPAAQDEQIVDAAAPTSGQPAAPVAASPAEEFSGAVTPVPPISVDPNPTNPQDAAAKESFNGWSMQRFTEGADEEAKTQ